MKFKEKNINGSGNEVFQFVVGKSELFILMDLLCDAYKKTPRSLFTQPFRTRVNAMKETMGEMMRNNGLKYPITRQEFQDKHQGKEEVF